MTFPADDMDFTDNTLTKVDAGENGWSVTREDGWSNFIKKPSPIEPKVGTIQRTYGKGTTIRGIFLDGQKVFYRTEAEDHDHHEIQMYGADPADWLARWDAGKTVWTIEMGGLGPGYEQCIHITAAEVLRYLIDKKVDPVTQYEGDAWKQLSDDINKALWSLPKINDLGLSGAQAGAAKSLATMLYKDGPRKVMNDPRVKDRHIQVSREFPRVAA